MAATPDPEEALLIRTVLYDTVTRVIDCCVANHCRQSQKATACIQTNLTQYPPVDSRKPVGSKRWWQKKNMSKGDPDPRSRLLIRHVKVKGQGLAGSLAAQVHVLHVGWSGETATATKDGDRIRKKRRLA